MSSAVAVAAAGAYLYLLFAVAYRIDRRGPDGRMFLGGSAAYALSVAVYCTSWTFYGSVGRSAETGLGFLPIYVGPLAVFLFGMPLLRKILRIAKAQHLTTIADFISARYGKSQVVAGLVTVIAVIGVMPYISLQLKAVSASFQVLAGYPAIVSPAPAGALSVLGDTAFYVAMLMSLFVIAFGTRQVDASEQHRGMVGAVALESLVKLGTFLAVGVFVCWGLHDSPTALFDLAAQDARAAPRLDWASELSSGRFWTLSMLAAFAILCLPRQFQVTVVENTDERHLRQARWIFPLYLVAINVFVLPIALAGLLRFGPEVSADTYVLALPIAGGRPVLATLAFIGGLSAATGMIIVETIALSTMICNDLVMPLVLRRGRLREGADLARLVKRLRRGAIVAVLLLGYAYVRGAGDSAALVSIGLVSFAAVAQFAPAMLIGLYWQRGSRVGAVAGLGSGFLVWAYTLLLPTFAQSGWLPQGFATRGAFGMEWLKPNALFGLTGLDSVSHGLLWSLAANVLCYVLFSLRRTAILIERTQAQAFVDASSRRDATLTRRWDARVSTGDLLALVARFVDESRVQRAYADHAGARGVAPDLSQQADLDTVNFAERLLTGAIGSALARVVVASAILEKQVDLEGVADLLSDASKAIHANWLLLREAVENVSQGICMWDASHRLVVSNQRFLELMGLPPHFGAVGVRFQDYIRYNAERGEYGEGDVERMVAERLDLVRRPHVIERERPNGVVIEISGKPLPDGGYLSTITDITERKRAEQALRRANDELERRVDERTSELVSAQSELLRAEKLAALGELVAGVAHEINTPVGIGLTAATYLEEQLRAFEQSYSRGDVRRSALEALLHTGTEATESIVANLRRAAELVRSFKLVAVDQSSEHKRLFEVRAYLDDVLRSLHPKLKRTKHAVHVNCPDGLRVESVPGAFSQIVTNLVMNSLIHGFDDGREGRIDIDVKPAHDRLLITYRDNGRGMPPDLASRMFEPFFTTRRGQGGSGLGLHLVYNVVTQTLKGRIEATTAPGRGVLFHIDVPCHPLMQETPHASIT